MGRIPSGAKKMFSGVIFDVYHWEQEMFDKSIETFEMLKRPNTVQVIATQGNGILYTKESQPTLMNFHGLLGGRVDPGETPQEAASRELLEEAGMQAHHWTLWKSFQPEHKIDWEIYYFIAHDCVKVTEPHLDAGEKIEVCSASFDEFIELTLSENFRSQELTFEILRMHHTHTLKNFEQVLFSKTL